MKHRKLKIFLIILLVIAVSVTAIFKVTFLRHASVRMIWGMLDKLSFSKADKAALPEAIETVADIPYIEDGLNEHRLDVYYPSNSNVELPAVVFIHGGGFISGDKKHVQQYCMTLAGKGYAVFNINYRLTPEYKNPAQIDDVMAAIEWVSKNCTKYNADPNKLVVAGDSAGAYLTGMAASLHTNEGLSENFGYGKPVDRRIKGVVLFCGVYDLRTGAKSGFPSIKSDIEMLLGTTNIEGYSDIDSLSVVKNVTDKFPPVYITSGEVDWLHSETVALIEVLKEKNIHYKSLLFDKKEKKAMHDYQFNLELDISKKSMEEVVEFINTVVK